MAHYTFDAGNANDSAGTNNGTLNNSPTFVAGISGSGINFNGNTQYVTVPYSSSLGLTGSYTVSFWENLNSASQNGNATFVSTRNGGETTFDLQYTGSGLHADIGNGSGGWLTTAADAAATLAPGVWNMLTYSVSSTGYNIYLNGAQIGLGRVQRNARADDLRRDALLRLTGGRGRIVTSPATRSTPSWTRSISTARH